METSPRDLWAVLALVAATLGLLTYVFLRMAGVISRHGRRDGRPPPPTPMG